MKKRFISVLITFILIGLLVVKIKISSNTQITAHAQEGTSVGGIIWDNSTWTSENSPYLITETVQIPANVTLIINPGVTVTCPSSTTMFLLSGKMIAQGTTGTKIIFDGGGNSDFFETANGEPFVNLSHCIIRNGHSLGCPMAPLNLSYSEVINVNGRRANLLFPEPMYIEYNTFINWAGIGAWADENQIHIKNNLFKGAPEGSLVTYILTAGFDVQYNSFIDINTSVLSLAGDFPSSTVTAANNYWGTTNTSIIDSLIIDGNDNIEIQGFIEYLPILTEPHPDTPTLFVAPEIYNFNVSIETQNYNITALSNSTITEFSFNQTLKELKFNAEGLIETTGFCNITIPAELMSGTFTLYKNDTQLVKNLDYTETYNGTYYLFEIHYNHSLHTIRIVSSQVIPDLPTSLLTILIIISLSTATLFLRKKLLKSKKNHIKT
jgi:hypothetical protein